MKIEEVISLVMTELNRAEDAHPDWLEDDVRIEEEAKVVRLIFEKYMALGSLKQTVMEINALGLRTREWTSVHFPSEKLRMDRFLQSEGFFCHLHPSPRRISYSKRKKTI